MENLKRSSSINAVNKTSSINAVNKTDSLISEVKKKADDDL